MGLRNDECGYDYQGNFHMSSLDEFQKAENRLKVKKQFLEDMQNEYDLLEQQAFNLYKSHVGYFKLSDTLIKSARDWMRMQKKGVDADGNKLDGRKNYEEKIRFNLLLDDIKEQLCVNNVVIDEIVEYNFGEAWEIDFTSAGNKWELEVPIVQNVSIKSYRAHNDVAFKLVLRHYDTKSSLSWVGGTFKEEELKDIFASGIEKFKEKETA